jgi:hypothetical protein
VVPWFQQLNVHSLSETVLGLCGLVHPCEAFAALQGIICMWGTLVLGATECCSL